jgi:hypothetical protein
MYAKEGRLLQIGQAVGLAVCSIVFISVFGLVRFGKGSNLAG